MNTPTLAGTAAAMSDYTTFYLGNRLIGIDIQLVQEINRTLEMTPIAHAPDYVRGVVNLRGEVVTVVDLRIILGLEPTELGPDSRNIIVNSGNERIGLLIDRVGDVERIPDAEIGPPPANVDGVSSRHLKGVYQSDDELLSILDIDETLMVNDTAS